MKSHSFLYNCELCGESLEVDKSIGYAAAKSKRGNLKHKCKPGAPHGDLEMVNERQVEQLNKLGHVKSINVQERLRRTYEIFGKPILDSYYIQPVPMTTLTQPVTEDRSWIPGFGPVEVAGVEIPPQTQGLTAEAVSLNQDLQDRAERYAISGGATVPGSDSGYITMSDLCINTETASTGQDPGLVNAWRGSLVNLFAAGEWSNPGAPPPDTGHSLFDLDIQDDLVEDGNMGAY
ncbi:hypothetical protein B0H67DRAFT_647389 [Lasiosphaeris hirsuta]|uniref:Uncharacterized protein n=1 Tax=Lasiosphaeris hirsuta TaxID=260670 RepID=A0AA40DSR7_9PEZI|nr:hypothetical protein B0H67DRAFT_647389 [Lasiosphaeris hirsuta]